MKTSFALLLIFAAITQHYAAGQSLSAEAEDRKGSCGDLVKQKNKKTTTAAPPASPSSAPVSQAPTSEPPVSDGQCQWVCTGETGSTGVATGGVTQPSGAPGSTGPGSVDYDCELTEAWYNISLILTGEDREIFIQFIEHIKITILIDITLTDIQKVVACSVAFRDFCSQHVEIYYKIAFQYIGSWGFCIDFIYVSVDLQADITLQIVTLDSNGDCDLFDALLNATQGNQEQYQAVLVLIEELRVEVFENVELTYAQKLAKCHEIFVQFFEAHVSWQSFFFSIEIHGYGSFESFFHVCDGYHKALTINLVISGSTDSDCVLLAALTEAAANTSFSLSVRNQIKELHDKIQAQWAIEVDINVRLQYISTTCYQQFLVEDFIQQFLDLINCEVNGELWGIFYDILWCATFCHNSNTCGNLGQGLGTSPAPSSTASTGAGSSVVVTSSNVVTETTGAVSTTEAPADCSKRPELIVVSSSNTTELTDCLTEHYNTWNTSVKLSFNSYFNQIRKAIWDNTNFPTPAVKISNIVTYFLNYNKNNANYQNIVMSITITEWRGTVRQFCDCGS